jgi:hypothetical protein
LLENRPVLKNIKNDEAINRSAGPFLEVFFALQKSNIEMS